LTDRQDALPKNPFPVREGVFGEVSEGARIPPGRCARIPPGRCARIPPGRCAIARWAKP